MVPGPEIQTGNSGSQLRNSVVESAQERKVAPGA
jgi:hypothetical protein